MYTIKEIGERVRTQDNQCTADPIYLVQVRSRLYGFDTQWSDDNSVWIQHGYGEADEQLSKELEDEWMNTSKEPEDWYRTSYIDIWEFVQPFFTMDAAQEYIIKNKYKYNNELRVYIDSGHRNYEWQTIRKLLSES